MLVTWPDTNGFRRVVSSAYPMPVTLASAGSLVIGKVGIDQTTPGTTDHVSASGFTAIVGSTLTRPNDTTAYAVGDIVAQSTTAGSCSGVAIAAARANDLTGMLRRCRVKVNDTAWAAAQLYVHLFKDTPTFAAGDNGAFTANLSESNYIGAFDVTFSRTFSDFVKGIGVPLSGSEINFAPSSGTQNVYFVLETRTAVTPAASKVFSVVLEALQN